MYSVYCIHHFDGVYSNKSKNSLHCIIPHKAITELIKLQSTTLHRIL